MKPFVICIKMYVIYAFSKGLIMYNTLIAFSLQMHTKKEIGFMFALGQEQRSRIFFTMVSDPINK